MNLHVALPPAELKDAVKEYVAKRVPNMDVTAVEITRHDGGRMGPDTYSAKAVVTQKVGP